MMVYICTKFHENILNGIRVMERTRKVNGRTDGRTDEGHGMIRPVFDGRIKWLSPRLMTDPRNRTHCQEPKHDIGEYLPDTALYMFMP